MYVDEVLAILRTGEGVSYDGEAVDELTHALQCGRLALEAAAAEEVVAAAALHDIGRAPAIRAQSPNRPHEDAGAAFCRPLFGDHVAWLVGSHVRAKRFLVAVQPGYAAGLSSASLTSLVGQGGRLMSREVEDFQAHAWSADAVRLRRWDDAAKTPGAACLPLSELADILERCSSSAIAMPG